jgi:hypothetical protein
VKLLTVLLLVLSSLGIAAFGQNAPANVQINLGTANEFAVLGASGITNVSAQTFIVGGVGSSPTPAITGLTQAQVEGPLYLVSSATTAQAQTGLTVAYNQAANAPCGQNLSGTDLGGLTLAPGVYCFSSSAGLTGSLTLDGEGETNPEWIFQIGSTLTTATGSQVTIVTGTKQLWTKGTVGCNVYWQVGSSATIGSGSTFVGEIMALASITLDGGTLYGKALASTGAVKMATQETVNGPQCVIHK